MVYLFQVYLVIVFWVVVFGAVLAVLSLAWLAFQMLAWIVRWTRMLAQSAATTRRAAAQFEMKIQKRMTVTLERFQWR